MSLGEGYWWSWKKRTRHDQNIVRAWIVYKGSRRAQFEVTVCNMSGLKIKLVGTVLVERQAYNFVEGFFYAKWK